MTAPCKDCPDRSLGCHASCSKYISYRKMQDEYNDKNRALNEVGDYCKRSIIKTKYKHVESVKSRINRRINYK